MSFLSRLRRTLAVLLVVVLCVSVIPVSAQDQGGSGLQISPTKTDIGIVAGEQRAFTIVVKNVTQGTLTVKTFINDFESDNLTGNPQLIVDTSKRSPYSLADFLEGLSDFELKPGESKEVKLNVNIPADKSPGAYFSAVRFSAIPKGRDSSTPEEGEQQVALTASVAHLVLIEVPGEINEQIQLESLKFQRDNKSSSFFLGRPDKAALSIKNLGNGFSRPFGQVTINRFGKEVYSYDVNDSDPKAIVLPKSSRTLVEDVKNIKMPGRYTATALVAYGNGAEVISLSTSFWYVPTWLIILLVFLLIALLAGGNLLYRKKFGKRQGKKNR